MTVIASVNGHLFPENEATISILERGFTLADGLFETMVARYEEVPHFERHIDRLQRGACVLGMPIEARGAVRSHVSRVLEANGLPHSIVRLTLSRGYDHGRGLAIPDKSVSSIVIRVSPRDVPIVEGVTLTVSSVRRNEGSPVSNVKSLAYTDNVVAKLRANRRGFDEALLLNNAGHVACTTSSNFFIVKDYLITTPPIRDGVLPGVVRSIILENASALSLNLQEGSIAPDFGSIDEAFITNTVAGVVPVLSVDGITIGSGKVGVATKKLSALYNAMV